VRETIKKLERADDSLGCQSPTYCDSSTDCWGCQYNAAGEPHRRVR